MEDKTTTGRQSSPGEANRVDSKRLDAVTRTVLRDSAAVLTELSGMLRELSAAMHGGGVDVDKQNELPIHHEARDGWRARCDGQIKDAARLRGAVENVTCLVCLARVEEAARARRGELQRAENDRENAAELRGMGRGAEVPGVARRGAGEREALRDEAPTSRENGPKLGEARGPFVTKREEGGRR